MIYKRNCKRWRSEPRKFWVKGIWLITTCKLIKLKLKEIISSFDQAYFHREYEPSGNDLKYLREWLESRPHIIQDYGKLRNRCLKLDLGIKILQHTVESLFSQCPQWSWSWGLSVKPSRNWKVCTLSSNLSRCRRYIPLPV